MCMCDHQSAVERLKSRAQRSVRPPAPVLQGFQGAVHYAELQTTMQGAHNSSACIAAGACLPLGSHSVWCAIYSVRDQTPGRCLYRMHVLTQSCCAGVFEGRAL